jgi:predicted pyridoxine 5'-phosphate oxidase superfamily flavin-nucleotide-binding protein
MKSPDACVGVRLPDSDVPSGPFHQGELQAQALAGFTTSGAAIRNFMPDQHRTFFAALPYVLLATTDDEGWPLATILAGEPGFISSPDPRSLAIATSPDTHDPVLSQIATGGAVGMLGIDFSTRRRNRANGVVTAFIDHRLHLDIQQSFGNCPKYIHVRNIAVRSVERFTPMDVSDFAGLDYAACELISSASTFFVATNSGQQSGAGGVDISHRGGAAGFVKVDGDTITCPDYLGNRYFNTLGNLILEPRAALLFIDFSNGDLLHLRGRAEILWQTDETQLFPGAERLWRFKVERCTRRSMTPYIVAET